MNPPDAPNGDRADGDLDVSPGIIDFQGKERRTELLRIACDIAAVARRYNEVHRAMFGFSMRRILLALQGSRAMDLPALESELESIESAAGRIERELNSDGLDDLPRRAKTAIDFRDALLAYSRAVSDAAHQLQHICHGLESETTGCPESSGYSETRFKHDKAAYDPAVQEYKRWGARLTELSRKI